MNVYKDKPFKIQEICSIRWKIGIIIRSENFSNRMLQVLRGHKIKEAAELIKAKSWTFNIKTQSQLIHQNKEVSIVRTTQLRMLRFLSKKKGKSRRQFSFIVRNWKPRLRRIKRRKNNNFCKDKIFCLSLEKIYLEMSRKPNKVILYAMHSGDFGLLMRSDI